MKRTRVIGIKWSQKIIKEKGFLIAFYYGERKSQVKYRESAPKRKNTIKLIHPVIRLLTGCISLMISGIDRTKLLFVKCN